MLHYIFNAIFLLCKGPFLLPRSTPTFSPPFTLPPAISGDLAPCPSPSLSPPSREFSLLEGRQSQLYKLTETCIKLRGDMETVMRVFIWYAYKLKFTWYTTDSQFTRFWSSESIIYGQRLEVLWELNVVSPLTTNPPLTSSNTIQFHLQCVQVGLI